MSESVLVMSIGPVQEFIAQARRSRDLWFGSHALSEVSRAAAAAAAAWPGVTMVFPPFDSNHPELAICNGVVRPKDGQGGAGQPPLNVGNHLLAIVPTDALGDIGLAMREAATARWQELATAVRGNAMRLGLLADDVDRVWSEQIDSLLEVTAAAADIAASGSYAAARESAEQVLAGRKNLREFSQWTHDRAGAPKSSFDGGRVSVLRDAKGRPAKAAAAVRLGRNEQLDAVAVVKRLGGEPKQFVPLANVALADWLQRARAAAPDTLEATASRCQSEGIDPVSRRDLPWVAWTAAGVAYDAEALLDARLGSLFTEIAGLEGDALKSHCNEWRRNVLDPLYRQAGPPPEPYVCCVVADGDWMGRAISSLAEPKQHRELSSALSSFSGRAAKVIADHSGLPVYTGGDDVLGFTCPSEAITVAAELHKAFAESMKSLAFLAEKPTLSVGLGVGHLMDGMAHLLALGRRAEKVAKGAETDEPKNALGVIVDKRAGEAVAWRGRWADSAVEQMRMIIESLAADRLSVGKVHEVRTVLQRLPSPVDGGGFDAVLRGEVTRILGRADGEGGHGLTPAAAGLRMPHGETGYQATHAAVTRWINACLAARAFVSVPGGRRL
jgi:CRISPR-associated protein Cmr2